jgi:hypothetical protein
VNNDLSFSTEQLVAAQKVLRDALQLPPERFPLQAFVGMISDEIEQLRLRGLSDGAAHGDICAESSSTR